MNEKGQVMMAKAREGIEGFIGLLILTVFFTPLIAVMAPYLLNAEIFPLGGITLFFIQAFLLIITITFFLRMMDTTPQQPRFAGQF